METVHFYVPFTKEELMKTVDLKGPMDDPPKPRTWNGEMGPRGEHMPDLLEQIEDFSDTAKSFKPPAKPKQAQIVLAGEEEVLKGLGANDTLYVMGHGAPGVDSLWSFDQDGENVTKLSAAEIVDRLKADGLNPDIKKIKLISCNSADSADATSFAEKFREAQVAKEFCLSAEVSCYQGSIGLVGKADGSKQITKIATEGEGEEATTVRASLKAMTFNDSNQLVNRAEHRASKLK